MSAKQRRAFKALEYLGYTFPKDKRQIVNTFEELPMEYLSQLRDVFKWEYGFALERMNELLDSVIFTVCDICDREKDAYGDIPKGWGWYDVSPKNSEDRNWYMMCDECQFRYAEKFGKVPEIVTEI